MKALIVDDSKLNLMVAQKILEKIGFSVDTVLSGEECLEKIKNNSYNIIFMDIMMPNMDGIETYNCLRKEMIILINMVLMNICLNLLK